MNDSAPVKSRSTMNINEEGIMDVPKMGFNEFNWHQDDLIESMVTLDN